jgi:hypothetical protein
MCNLDDGPQDGLALHAVDALPAQLFLQGAQVATRSDTYVSTENRAAIKFT